MKLFYVIVLDRSDGEIVGSSGPFKHKDLAIDEESRLSTTIEHDRFDLTIAQTLDIKK